MAASTSQLLPRRGYSISISVLEPVSCIVDMGFLRVADSCFACCMLFTNVVSKVSRSLTHVFSMVRTARTGVSVQDNSCDRRTLEPSVLGSYVHRSDTVCKQRSLSVFQFCCI